MKHGLIDHASLQRMLYDELDQSDDIVLVLERTGEATDDLVMVSANESFCRTSGYAHADVIGQSLRSLSAIAAEPSPCVQIEQAALERRSCQTELMLKRKSGEPFWFGLHMMPVREAGPARFVMLGRDITERLRTRDQQAAIQGLLAKVFQCVKAPVAIVASDTGKLQMSNPALDEFLGYAAGVLVGKLSVDLICAGWARRASGGTASPGKGPSRVHVGDAPASRRWHGGARRDHLHHGAARRSPALSDRHGAASGGSDRFGGDRKGSPVQAAHSGQDQDGRARGRETISR